MFVEQEIGILEWFLKDHVTLKTGVTGTFLYRILSGNIFDKTLAVREQRFGPFTRLSSVAVRLLLALKYLVMISSLWKINECINTKPNILHL